MRELLPVAGPSAVRAELAELLRPRWRLGLAALATLVAASAVSLLTAPLLGRIVDLVAAGRPAASVHGPVLALVAVALGQGLLFVLGVVLVNQVGEATLARLRERFVERALALPLERIERAGSGDLTSRVGADVALVSESVRDAVPQFTRSILMITLTLVGLAVLDWRFAVAALLAVPVQVGTARWYLRRSSPMYRAQREAGGAQQQQLLDTVGGAATVRAFRLRADHLARVAERSDAVVSSSVRAVRLQTGFFNRLNIAELIGVAAVLLTGFWLVRSGTASVGTASAAALYFINLFGPVNQALFQLDTVQSSGAALARLVGLRSAPGESSLSAHGSSPAAGGSSLSSGGSSPAAGGSSLSSGGSSRAAGGSSPAARTVLDGSVTISGVSFGYDGGPEVLHDVHLKLPEGSRTALVGATGAGKSTLAKLVSGVHSPSAGSVRIGGAQVDGTGTTVALVTQEVHVFAGTLADDLRLARPNATREQLLDALATVGALDWALALPDGLDTVVGSGGRPLTTVRSQQLALARLVLADPPVAVLDEATAEAGSAGARVLDNAASRALTGRTALLVAHRLSQAATADLVVVLDNGRIVEQGTHAELVAAAGRYAHLWTAWQRTH